MKPAKRKTVRKNVTSKVLILGEPNVGKTSLVNRFCEGVSFNESSCRTSNKELVHEKTRDIKINDANGQINLTMRIYDCAGDNSTQNLLNIYWKGVNAIVLVYSIDSTQSFDKLWNWIDAMNKTKRPDEVVHIALVASKSDL